MDNANEGTETMTHEEYAELVRELEQEAAHMKIRPDIYGVKDLLAISILHAQAKKALEG